MTDERFVFTQDVKERSQMKTGAFHKKNGSKSKKCTFPSDHLTAKQKKKLNGECETLKLNEPFRDWKAFKKYSVTMKTAYLDNLIHNYGARQKDVAEMFGITPNTIYLFCKELGIRFPKGGHGTGEMDDRFLDFLTKPAGTVEAKEEEQEDVRTMLDKEIASAILIGDGRNDIFDDELMPYNKPEIKKYDPTESAKTSGQADAVYLHSCYEKLIELGFTTNEAITMTIERSKLRLFY